METEKRLRQKWRLLKATMDERGRRLWAGAEADVIGWGGVAAVARATGMAISTVRKGRDEARAGARRDDVVKTRRSTGKRPYCTAPRSARRVVPRSARGFPFPFPLASGVMGIGNAEAITGAA